MIEPKENVLLAPFTSFGIGGPARYLAEVRDADQLREALRFARDQGLPFFLMGGGSNILVSDRGFGGVVIRLSGGAVRREGNEVEAEAGVDLTGLVHATADWGLSGAEPLAGIPGLVGGAVRGNAGAYGGSLGEVCQTVRVLDSGTLEELSLGGQACRFAYRNSRFKEEPGLVVLSARLVLTPAPVEETRQRVAATLAKRAARNLQCEGSVGSFFMNPRVEDQELIARFEQHQKVHSREGRIPAGWLIDQASLRGERVGGAQISALHANYLVNAGGASARDVLLLARLVKERVRQATGVRLEEEVSRLGFSAEELAL